MLFPGLEWEPRAEMLLHKSLGKVGSIEGIAFKGTRAIEQQRYCYNDISSNDQIPLITDTRVKNSNSFEKTFFAK